MTLKQAGPLILELKALRNALMKGITGQYQTLKYIAMHYHSIKHTKTNIHTIGKGKSIK